MLSRRDSNTQRIAALDAQARALNLKAGMGVGEARAMHPNIEAVEAEPEADRRLLEGLADWCDRYTPLVALDGTDGLFLDITGCAHLFGGERGMMDDLLCRFFHQGFEIRAGLASTPGAAWAAARFSGDLIVAPGQEEELISPLPLSALRIDPGICGSLESVGLRTVGAVMAAPRAPLTRRFGPTLLLRLDQALGQLEEAISPRLPVAALSVERHLAEPIILTDDIELLTKMLAESLKAGLERRCEGARSLMLSLFRVDGEVSRIAISMTRPLREPSLVQRLFRERFTALNGTIDAGYGFDLVRLSALSVAPFAASQADFTGEGARDETDIALFADRVRARLGDRALSIAVAVESHWPERAVRHLPFSEPPPAFGRDSREENLDRPINLFAMPEPIEVPVTEIPERPPLNFRWRRALYRIARSEGPERIAPEWWRQGEAETLPRDYFRVEDADGRRFWLYRQGLYEAGKPSPRWFMHGIFA
ncbi:DNA polymerase Y family protein [Mesorhizobium sp. CN2-181]|uniref:Y-family DNA polymerase n=1 Tax=Mesorhizobium yinganensis TaxID=3157707 RepID=UPI0032B86AA0